VLPDLVGGHPVSYQDWYSASGGELINYSTGGVSFSYSI